MLNNLLLTLVFIAGLNATVAMAANSLCEKGEINFSSCTVGRKTASFCASKSGGPEDWYLQYRFGTAQKLELVVPDDKRKSRGVFFNSMHNYSDGDEIRLSFKHGNYTYVFFNLDSRHGDSRGIHIVRSGSVIKTLPCTNPVSDHASIPDGLIGNEDFVFFN